jgi:hypothetical protein
VTSCTPKQERERDRKEMQQEFQDIKKNLINRMDKEMEKFEQNIKK